ALLASGDDHVERPSRLHAQRRRNADAIDTVGRLGDAQFVPGGLRPRRGGRGALGGRNAAGAKGTLSHHGGGGRLSLRLAGAAGRDLRLGWLVVEAEAAHLEVRRRSGLNGTRSRDDQTQLARLDGAADFLDLLVALGYGALELVGCVLDLLAGIGDGDLMG